MPLLRAASEDQGPADLSAVQERETTTAESATDRMSQDTTGPMTVRDMVARIQGELRKGALEPDAAREHLITLSALYGNCLQEIREADADYAVVLLAHLDSAEKANRAKIRAETSSEYQRKQEARDTKELVLEMIRALKYLLRSLSEEMQLAR